MPRRYDFSRKPTPEEYQATGSFAPLPAGRATPGPGEVGTDRFFAAFPGGPATQFSYSSKGDSTVKHYDNERLDPVYDWLCRNMRGSWHWLELVCNHGHSVAIEIWIDRPRDAERFIARWEDRFETHEWAVAQNAKLRGTADETPGFERTPAINLYSVTLDVLAEDDVIGHGSLFVLATDIAQAQRVAHLATEDSHLWDERIHDKSIRFRKTEEVGEDDLPAGTEIHSWMLIADQEAAAAADAAPNAVTPSVQQIYIHHDVRLTDLGNAQLVLHPDGDDIVVNLVREGDTLMRQEITWTTEGLGARFTSGTRLIAAKTMTWAEIDAIRARLAGPTG